MSKANVTIVTSYESWYNRLRQGGEQYEWDYRSNYLISRGMFFT